MRSKLHHDLRVVLVLLTAGVVDIKNCHRSHLIKTRKASIKPVWCLKCHTDMWCFLVQFSNFSLPRKRLSLVVPLLAFICKLALHLTTVSVLFIWTLPLLALHVNATSAGSSLNATYVALHLRNAFLVVYLSTTSLALHLSTASSRFSAHLHLFQHLFQEAVQQFTL